MTYALALLLLVQSPPRITIYYDTNFESRVLVSELQRDWLMKDTPLLAEMARKSVVIRDAVRLVAKKDELRLREIYDGYPFIQYGTNGDLETIDRRAFTASGCCLDTVYALVMNANLDLSRWRNQCEHITREAEETHYHTGREWLRLNLPEELIAHGECSYEWGLAENRPFMMLQERFASYDGFPVFRSPKLPAKPVLLMPWE